MRVQRALTALQRQISILPGSGKISTLAAVVAAMTLQRIGNQSTSFEFSDTMMASMLLDVTDALYCLIGPSYVDDLRIRSPVLSGVEALSLWLLTQVVESCYSYFETVMTAQLS